MQLPNYLMGQVNGFGDGIDSLTNALYRFQDQQAKQRQLAMEQERFGLEQRRFGLQERDSNRAYQSAMDRQNAFNALFANGQPAWAKSLPPGAVDVARVMGPEGGPQALSGIIQRHPEMAMERERLSLQNRALAEQITQRQQMYPLQQKELELKTRALEQKDPERMLMERMFRNLDQQQGGGASPAPVPRLQPQSFDGGEQPAQLIQTQAGGQAPAPRQPDEMVSVPGMGQMPKSQAETMQFLMSKDRGQVIGDAIKKNDLSKEARNEIDKNEVNLTEQLGRLREIKRQFKPEFLTYEQQAKQYGISWLDKFDATRTKLAPEQLKQHADYTAFRRDTVDNLNRYIKEITGAAMGVEEAKRIISSMPNMDDSPTQFEAKLKATAQAAELAVARARILRREGFNGQAWDGRPEAASRMIPLDRMKSMILEDTKRVYQQIRNQHPQADESQINGAVRSLVRGKYGMDI